MHCDWFHHWDSPSGQRWLSCAKGDGYYLLRFHDLADFLVLHNGQEITCSPAAHTPQETVRHLLLDQVIPLVVNLRGQEALHASAVVTPYRACAFLGEQGWGKSTLAASFLKSGCALLSDDCLVLVEDAGEICGVPSYPGQRLWPEVAVALYSDALSLPAVAHYTRKRRVDGSTAMPALPVPMQGVYILAAPSAGEQAITIHPLSPREGLMGMLRHAFRLDITDRIMLHRQLRFFEKVLARVPVRCLTYPRDLSLLPTVQEVILQDMARNRDQTRTAVRSRGDRSHGCGRRSGNHADRDTQ